MNEVTPGVSLGRAEQCAALRVARYRSSRCWARHPSHLPTTIGLAESRREFWPDLRHLPTTIALAVAAASYTNHAATVTGAQRHLTVPPRLSPP